MLPVTLLDVHLGRAYDELAPVLGQGRRQQLPIVLMPRLVGPLHVGQHVARH